MLYRHQKITQVPFTKVVTTAQEPRTGTDSRDETDALVIAATNQLDIRCDLFPIGLIYTPFGQTYESLWDLYQGKHNITALQWTTKLINQIPHVWSKQPPYLGRVMPLGIYGL